MQFVIDLMNEDVLSPQQFRLEQRWLSHVLKARMILVARRVGQEFQTSSTCLSIQSIVSTCTPSRCSGDGIQWPSEAVTCNKRELRVVAS